ncbi:hypothetical protein [Saccharomonospora iraqiensis]|uniref:hypothetical protein n=1 Tax=Saccharomonospora iraqiensis TaxID=52698 RepID=UPI0004178F28|nr:hypothetical protein [Saccharomonospora iraqiensis]
MTGTATSSAAALLDHARTVLAGRHTVPAAQVPRAAAILARQALEDAVEARCRAAGAELGGHNQRSRLIVLRMLVGGPVSDSAATAWAGLSRACHHHAYELAPTVGEVAQLIEHVAAVVTSLPEAHRPEPAASRPGARDAG